MFVACAVLMESQSSEKILLAMRKMATTGHSQSNFSIMPCHRHFSHCQKDFLTTLRLHTGIALVARPSFVDITPSARLISSLSA